MAIIKEAIPIDDSVLYLADLDKKDKIVKLDNLLTALNIDNFIIEKIKIISISDGQEKLDVEYGAPKNNELYALNFKDIDDIIEFKIKGKISGNKFNILLDFSNNFLQIKVKNDEKINKKLINKIAEKF